MISFQVAIFSAMLAMALAMEPVYYPKKPAYAAYPAKTDYQAYPSYPKSYDYVSLSGAF